MQAHKKKLRLGNVIREWRLAKGMTLRDTGKLVGIHNAVLYRLECGLNPDGRTLAKILQFLLEEA